MIRILQREFGTANFASKQIASIEKGLRMASVCVLLCWITVNLQAQTPGGVTGANYRWIAWLTPDGYSSSGNSGVWVNNFTGPFSVGNFNTQTNQRTPRLVESENNYNFHKSVQFVRNAAGGDNANRMLSAGTFDLNGRNVAVFAVLRLDRNGSEVNSGSGNLDYLNLISFSNVSDNSNILWIPDGSPWGGNVHWNWGGGNLSPIITEPVARNAQGIFSFINSNGPNNSGQIFAYLNGNLGTAQGMNKPGPITSNERIRLSSNSAGTYSFQGYIHEIIVVSSGADNTPFPPADLQKIHSYLSVKYGIPMGTTINGGNCLSSSGGTVWDRTRNANYNNAVFGIASDSATKLTQLQSKSQGTLGNNGDNSLALYRGTYNINTDAPLTDGEYVMVGSNGASGQRNYSLNKDTLMSNGNPLGETLNFRTEVIYKTQITNGSLTSQNGEVLNMRLTGINPNLKFVMVSDDASFDPARTRYYPISLVAPTIYNVSNVTLYDGEFISFGGYEPTPGGMNMTGFQLDVWVDGDNSTNNSWTSLANTQSRLRQAGTSPTPIVRNSNKFNFHKELNFNNGNQCRLITDRNYNLAVGESYHVFVVSDLTNTGGSTTDRIIVLTFNNMSDRTVIRWHTESANNSNVLSANWNNTQRCQTSFAAASNPRFGIVTMNIVNRNSSANNEMYLNGRRATFSLGTSTDQGAGTSSTHVSFGNENNSGRNWDVFNGSMQEIILIRRTAGQLMHDTDIQKVHSYLAIKYGITLINGIYRCSYGDTVWSLTRNQGYNNNIFGIARDKLSALTQVQSTSCTDNLLAVYKGNWNTLNDNGSQLLRDSTYAMFGSNNANGQRLYRAYKTTINPSNNSPLGEKLNFRTERIYKAQLTHGSLANNGEEVNMRLTGTSPNLKFVMVSNSTTFDTNNTRYYPITQISNNVYNANNIIVYDGDFISFCGFEPTPGGVNMTGCQLDIWIDGDHSTASSWTPLALSRFQFERGTGSAPAPLVQTSTKFNFHQELNFGPHDTYRKIRTTENDTLRANESYHFFIVSDATVGRLNSNNTVFTINNSSSNTCLRWVNGTANNTSILRSFWTGTERNPNFQLQNHQRMGIATLDVINRSQANSLRMFLNGTAASYNPTNSTLSTTNNRRFMLGSADEGNSSGDQFNGTIQEVIVVRRFSQQLMPDADIQKIHTYLALKYGITISTNYLSSDSIVVWDRTANAPYNQNIIGIARDDYSGLYQKQARSATFRYFSAYLGNNLASLNSQNNSTLEEGQYVVIGQNSNTPIQSVSLRESQKFVDSAIFLNDTLFAPVGINIKSGTFKTQFTRLDSININLQAPSADFSSVLVSKTDTFGLAETKVYHLNGRTVSVTLDTAFKYFVFVGFAPGPAGVSRGLVLWMRADDEAALVITNRDIGEDGLRTASNNPSTAYPNTWGLDPNSIPTVEEWKDLPRQHTYKALPSVGVGSNTVNSTGERYPVFHPDKPEMNFHPSIEFWDRGGTGSGTGGTSYASGFFGNSSPILPAGVIENPVVIMLTNNDFSTNEWVFPFGFGSNVANNNINAPAFGMSTVGNAVSGRVRLNGDLNTNFNGSGEPNINGLRNLFEAGSTSCLMFDHRLSRATNNNNNQRNHSMTFRFNGRFETRNECINVNLSNYSFNQASKIGSPFWNTNRTIRGFMSELIMYDGSALHDTDKVNIQSYLAIKYGITLRPTNMDLNIANGGQPVGFGRFDYSFSSGEVFWRGNVDENDLVDGKFARFYNRVTAIIRDDAAHLQNVQSHSTNVGGILRMGVAGSMLSNNGELLGELTNNLTAVAWGDDNNTGLEIVNDDPCGAYDSVFSRVWLVHKAMGDPIRLLVAAENLNGLTIGRDPATVPYYNKLTDGYNVTMVVAKSPDSLKAANFNPTAVIPMTFINGMHQCNYMFTDTCTYVTFAVKSNGKGCSVGRDETAFNGLHMFDWQRFTNNINRVSNHVPRVPRMGLVHPNVDNNFVFTNLGDNIRVNTYVEFDNPVRAGSGFPSTGTSPVRGTLQVRRAEGRISSSPEVRIHIQFREQSNTNNKYPVIPAFTISGIDGNNQSYDSVVIEGQCGTQSYFPILSYASGPNRNTAYRIIGNTATAILRNNIPPTNLNGRMNVEFEAGVTDIVIKYQLKNRIQNSPPQSIFISPLNLRAVMPPPPFDEAGISFVQTAMPQEVSICREVTYTWRVQNANCTPKPVNFSVGLPSFMKWLDESLGLDSSYIGNATYVRPYGETDSLIIDSLIIPGGTTAVFRAVAHFDENAPAGEYTNRAMLQYGLIVQNREEPRTNISCDGLTMGCEPTSITALEGVILKKLEIVDFTMEPECYTAGDTISVSLTVNNPNDVSLEDAALEIFYNNKFHYLRNSFQSSEIVGTDAINTDDYADMFLETVWGENTTTSGVLAIDTADGDNAESLIFLAQPIPSDISVITFKLVAPNVLVQDSVERNGQMFGVTDSSGAPMFVNLNVSFDFFTRSEDDCAGPALYNAYGDGFVPATPVVSIYTRKQICIGDTSRLSRWEGGTWASSNPSVATVDAQTGVVTGVGGGKAVFYFTVENSTCSRAVTDTLTVWDKAPLTSDTVAEICTGAQLGYLIRSSAPGATFSWSRAAVNGISNPAQAQTVPNANVTINERLNLNNSSGGAIVVDYTIYIHSHGCVDEYTLHVTVKPLQTPTVRIRRRR